MKLKGQKTVMPDITQDKSQQPGSQLNPINRSDEIIEEWVKPIPEETPEPTFWPISLAMSTIFILWGFISTWIISAVGIVLFSISVRGWVRDLLNEQPSDKVNDHETV